MLRWVLGLLLLIPLLDIIALIYIAGFLGVAGTVALVVLTGLIGVLLVHAEGRNTLYQLQRRIISGELPANELLDGALLLVAGALLLTPGLLTDAIGLLLVLPPSRYPIRAALKRWIIIPVFDKQTSGFITGDVYTYGFPNPPRDAQEPYDLDEDRYTINVDDGSDNESGKRNP